ncbi:MAG: filamentous hemagglutinin N-terminal domain-containing protein [Syntrophaceae bacterium]|nr:filamentous hemagglutinin N-terminal domain-containing protein [Syntrophaceae bacterium]
MKTDGWEIREIVRMTGIFFLMAILLLSTAGPVRAFPSGAQVINGQVSFSSQGNMLTITNSPSSIINWQAFSIGTGEAVRFVQQSSTSAVLNRVVGLEASLIQGLLQSNGTVFLINPNGIVIGPGARIDVNGFIASTLGLSDQDFLARKYNFTAGATAADILNQGTISTPSGGKVYLIAPNVENSGLIYSPNGDIMLAAGQSVQMVDSLSSDIAVVVSAPKDSALNLGQIVAESGKIGIYGGLIAQNGLVSANSATVGEGGRIVFRATNGITLDTGSRTTANGTEGGRIEILSEDGTTAVSGSVTATGTDGKGGDIAILGDDVEITGAALVDASGGSGGGSVLIGGDYQGANAAVPNAETTYVGSDVVIKADALDAGDGGKVVLWSDDTTSFYGSISARGGVNGGNGGNVEVSGKKTLVYRGLTDVRAPLGTTGTLLLDPTNYFIQPVGGDITGADLGAQLELANVTIQTATAGVQNGDLYVDDTVTWASGNKLTLNAHNDIWMNNVITNNGGGSLVLRADSDGSGGGNVYFAGIGHVNMTGGGIVSIFYNPPAGYGTPTDYTANVTGVTPTAYMLVNTVTDLQNINNNLAGTYALGTDIDASATTGWNAGAGFLPLGDDSLIEAQSFRGIFDGLGHTITGLFINRPTLNYIGLFGGCTAAAVIRNVGMENVDITGNFQVAGLVAHTGGSIDNCYVTGSVTAITNTVGGLVALTTGSVTNCYSAADVTGVSYVGGLIGSVYFATGTVTNSYSVGIVSGAGASVGGLIGQNADTSFSNVTSSYWNTDIFAGTSAGGTGKTTAEMQTQATFVGWDFVNTWELSAGLYPKIVGLASGTATPATPATPTAGTTTTSSIVTLSDATATGSVSAANNTVTALTTLTGTISPEGQGGGVGPGGSEENRKEGDNRGEGTQETGDGTGSKKGTTFCN